MKRSGLWYRILKGAYSCFIVFLLVAFLVTCSTSLFIKVFSETLNIELTGDNLQWAAKLTLINVFALSVLFTVLNAIRKKLTTDRAAKHITTAATAIINGDFDVRISPLNKFSIDDNYNVIIDCFNTMADELSGVETLRNDFIANVSHEMKTPLAVMQNYGTLLQTPELSEKKRIEYAKAITDAARRLADMMTNVLRLNRLENQQVYPELNDYDLGEQLCECFLQYESVWESRGIEIVTDIEENVTVRADMELLSLVWNNLFSNAFKFTENGGRVTLSLFADSEYATVRVSNTGCGMSAEVGTHIFEKFYQGDSSHATQGNGLGLALVKRVVDIMHGEISVESAVGEGTAFTVKIRRKNGGLEEDI